jgi:hypothetical protein
MPEQNHTIQAVITKADLYQLQSLAAAKQWKLSQYVRNLIEQHLRRKGVKA